MTLFKTLSLSMLLISVASCTQKPEMTANYQVIPLPQEIAVDSVAEGFVFNGKTTITCSSTDESMQKNAELLASYLAESTGITPAIKNEASKNTIVLTDTLSNQNSEAYNISVNSDVLFPAADIFDAPRFAYRGAHFDTSRHFFAPDSVKIFIDMIAMHNINRFHWHITDDQGWRIEIKSRPELTEKGSMRSGTMIGKQFSTNDSIPYGGSGRNPRHHQVCRRPSHHYHS